MKYKTLDEIKKLIWKFENFTLPHSEWTHNAHLIVALWYLMHYSESEATDIICSGIQRYNFAMGIKTTKNSGYHATMTMFWIRIVDKYLSNAVANCSILEIANKLIKNYGNSSLPFE